jgi:hypothetical protein
MLSSGDDRAALGVAPSGASFAPAFVSDPLDMARQPSYASEGDAFLEFQFEGYQLSERLAFFDLALLAPGKNAFAARMRSFRSFAFYDEADLKESRVLTWRRFFGRCAPGLFYFGFVLESTFFDRAFRFGFSALFLLGLGWSHRRVSW